MAARAHNAKPWYRPRNIALAMLAIVVIIIGWFVREVLLVLNGKPNPATNYRAQFRELSEKDAGPHEHGDEAWALMVDATRQAGALIKEFDDSLISQPFTKREDIDDGRVDFGYVRDGKTLRADVERERRAIALLREKGVFEKLSRFAAMGPGFRQTDSPGPMYQELMPELAQARTLAKARAASMRLAFVDGDGAEVARAVEELLAMDSTISRQPGLICELVGLAIESLTLSELRRELNEGGFDAAACKSVLASLDKHRPASVELTINGERAAFHDILQHICTDDGHGDGFLIASDVAVELLGSNGRTMSIGGAVMSRFFFATRQEMAGAYDQFMDQCILESRKFPSEWWTGTFTPDSFMQRLGARYRIVTMIVPAIDKAMSQCTLSQVEHEATSVMTALELYRRLYGRFPDSLKDLAPGVVPVVPVDPLHGGPFGYRLLTNDPDGRPYLLYSTGFDKTDDGGQLPEGEYRERDAVLVRGSKGIDSVLNPPRESGD